MTRLRLALFLLVSGLSACGFSDSSDVDDSPPAVQITKPAVSSVHGEIDFAASVIDEGGVEDVEFFVNNVSIGTDATEPYQVRWNTTTLPDGEAQLKVTATDKGGNQTSASKLVTIINDPN